MCSEAVWWRCHRRIISGHLLARGATVCHIMGQGKITTGTLTLGARVRNAEVIYPKADEPKPDKGSILGIYPGNGFIPDFTDTYEKADDVR